MILGTRNYITFMCKKLHTFVKVSIKIIPISFWAGPITENVNQVPLSLIKICLLFKKMNEESLDVWIYIIREIMISNIYDVYFSNYYLPNISLYKDRILYKIK